MCITMLIRTLKTAIVTHRLIRATLEPSMLGLENCRSKLIFALLVAGLLLPSSHFSYAESMSSDNYLVQSDTISQGGGYSTSSNFTADDTLGELATGDQGSENWNLCTGYQCTFREQFISFRVGTGLT